MHGEKGVPGPVGPRVSTHQLIIFCVLYSFFNRALVECLDKLVFLDKQGTIFSENKLIFIHLFLFSVIVVAQVIPVNQYVLEDHRDDLLTLLILFLGQPWITWSKWLRGRKRSV